MGRGDWLETIEDLKQEGKIRFFGVSVNDYQPDNVLDLVRSGHVDAVQVIYNAFHQAPGGAATARLRPARRRRHRPGRAGRRRPDRPDHPRHHVPRRDFRTRFFGGDRKAQVKQHADALVAGLGIDDGQLAGMALRYVLSQDAVSTVIAGMRTIRNVERNAAAGDGSGLDAAQRAIVAKHRWERNFYQS